MPNSYVQHTGDGSETEFSLVGIDGWINSGFLKVYLDNVLQTTGYTFDNLDTAPIVIFASAPADETIIRVQRETPATVSGFQGNIVDFNNASVLTEEDLDNMAKGLLHIAQENADVGKGALGSSTDGVNWDAGDRRITNTATPVDDKDAATKVYVDSVALFGVAGASQLWTFAAATGTTFSLSPVPGSTNENLFVVTVDGVVLAPSAYNITESTIVLGSSITNKTLVVRNFGSMRSIGSVDTAGIIDGAVTSDKIQTGAVTASKLASNAVETAKINASAVTEAKLATGSVTADKIGTDAVTSTKILNGAVTASKLAAGAAVSNIGYSPVNAAGTTTITGTLSVPTPSSAAHAATKQYVDTQVAANQDIGTVVYVAVGNYSIIYQSVANTFTISGSTFRCSAGQTWVGGITYAGNAAPGTAYGTITSSSGPTAGLAGNTYSTFVFIRTA